ncbi:MAG: DNA repair protein RecN [Candidatus Kryptoniota bacterium]
MLKTLFIKNFALIDQLELEFGPGLNIITGETGAGKSIIIDALSLVLGERASTDMIRSGADRAVVEAVFNIAGNKRVKELLQSVSLDSEDEIIVRREVNVKGQSRGFINDTPVPIIQMKSLGDVLIDLHGQHEHQSLLRPETHIDLIDDFGGLGGLLRSFREKYSELSSLIDSLSQLISRRDLLNEKKELYSFQIKEIDLIDPHPDELEKLESELKILQNAEKLYEATTRLYQMLYENDSSVHDQLVIARNQLEDLSEIDPSFVELKDETETARTIVDEITHSLQNYSSKIEFDPQRLEDIRERIGNLVLLQKKYGGSIEAVISYRQKIGEEFKLAENFDEEIAKLQSALETKRKELSEIAERLSMKRREVSEHVSASITDILAEIGIEKAKFEVNIENRVYRDANPEMKPLVKLGNDFYETDMRGFDKVEFYISTNVGEQLKPLARSVSGGEVSRIMLALKTILAKSDRLPVLVFDEIDTGISGRIAAKVGKSLKNLSSFHQIIAITHLPQIAGKADRHFLVEKTLKGKRTVTRVRCLSDDERIQEVARLLSGDDITKAGIEGAKELIGLK